MPDVLYPDVCAGEKEEPLNGYEEEADEIAGHRNADEEHGERLANKLCQAYRDWPLMQNIPIFTWLSYCLMQPNCRKRMKSKINDLPVPGSGKSRRWIA